MASHRIGTEREQSLHRALKLRYSGARGDIEVIRAGYVCDGVSEDGEMIEVQTGSFGPLKKKVPELLRLGPVRIVHPIIIRKSIETQDAAGALLRSRKSPRKGTPWDVFKALLYAPELPLLPGLTLELALVDVLEKRILDGKGSWRRKGASITDKTITEYHETMVFNAPRDYRYFLPFKKGETFTVKSLAEKAGIAPELARKALYVLTRIGVVERIGKDGNAWVYRGVQGHVKKRPRGRGIPTAGCL
ncbi:hypothetical protein [Treponema primitia]|uniref:hypothetical protein n=1 Tax=Treponema primitia TaxID=88058 RepID=UPI0002555348|nr:hypothetical protein [Treponema primitia]